MKRAIKWMFTVLFTALLVCTAMLPGMAGAQVSLYTTVDMALRNSASIRIATADVEKAKAALSESKDVYKPSFVFGSGLGYSYGFPVGQPSIYNVTSQSLVFNYSQQDYIRSAHAGLKASELALKDARQQIILDTALDYIQLDHIARILEALADEAKYADQLVEIEQQRLEAGLDSRSELLRAKLTSSRIRLKRIHLQNQAEDLRQQLAHLTGLPASQFITSPKSIPAAPEFKSEGVLNVGSPNSGVRAAYETAKSKMYVYFGDRRQNFRPQVAFVAQYNRYAAYNNYSDYYKNFQQNNFGIGVEITIPLFDTVRRDKARQSSAEAGRAAAVADQSRYIADEQVLRLQKSLAELQAQEQIADLQQQLSQSQLESIDAQLQNGSGSSSSAATTPKDAQLARIEERQRFEDSLDSKLELTRAQLSLLRAVGAIEDWAKMAPQ